MKILRHHIYEFKKGIRNLVLHTLHCDEKAEAEKLLNRYDIAYVIQPVSERKINIFFGNRECVAIIESFGTKMLYEFTDEEDFILGIMLGYGRLEQCNRLLKRKEKNKVFYSRLIENIEAV